MQKQRQDDMANQTTSTVVCVQGNTFCCTPKNEGQSLLSERRFYSCHRGRAICVSAKSG